MSPFVRFLLVMLALDFAGLLGAAVLAPPDPSTQLYYVLPVLLLSPAVALYVVYVRGTDYDPFP